MNPKTLARALAAAPLLLALGAGPAAAQDRPAPRPSGGDLAPDTEFTFDDDEVLGGTLGPSESLIHVRQRGQRVSLVRPRVHFVPEMLKSVETL